ncbi:hypothetical protein NDU88_004269 [Pleurodeles waltl]|uniref:Uncharacterized protein n=1 Tax=Pleurodeles waltl TaxID=8319 RepID=A0AAV7UHP3_PLEWA|nr:hypothetical protein NDU88_004269 [Pleurodeles waltl]
MVRTFRVPPACGGASSRPPAARLRLGRGRIVPLRLPQVSTEPLAGQRRHVTPGFGAGRGPREVGLAHLRDSGVGPPCVVTFTPGFSAGCGHREDLFSGKDENLFNLRHYVLSMEKERP